MTIAEIEPKNRTLNLRWRERANMPLPRAGYMAGIIDKKLVIAGGSYWEEGEKIWTPQVDIFDPRTNRWRGSTPMPSPRSDAAVVSVGSALYLFGGGAGQEVRSDGWVFRGEEWSALTNADLPAPRLYASAVSLQGKIYLTGGLSKAGDYSTATNTLWVWDSKTPDIGWQELSPIPGPGRINLAMARLGAKIYVFGGATSNGQSDVRNLDDVYSFDIRTLTWSQHPNLPLARRAWWAVTMGRSFILLGGCTDGYEEEVFQYHPRSAEFIKIGLLPHGLADTKFFAIGSTVVGAGGETAHRIRGPWTLQAEVTTQG